MFLSHATDTYVNFELCPGHGKIPTCFVDFDALAQWNAYDPQMSRENVGPKAGTGAISPPGPCLNSQQVQFIDALHQN